MLTVPDGDAAPGSREAPGNDAVERCARETLQGTPPALAEALVVLDQEEVVRDACRLRLAEEAVAPSGCQAITLEPLREACQARTAMLSGQPDGCPAFRGSLGRDPVCVAVALRSPALCAACTLFDRRRCLALLSRDPRRCGTGEYAPECAREVTRLGPRLPLVEGQPYAPGTASVVVSRGDAGAPEVPYRGFDRGVFLDASGALWLVDPLVSWDLGAVLPGADPRVAVRILRPSAAREVEVTVEAKITLSDLGTLDTRDGTTRAVARLTRFPEGRRGHAAGVVRWEGLCAGRPVTVTLRFQTFVRDVLPRPPRGYPAELD